MMKTVLLFLGLVSASLVQAAEVYDCQFVAIDWSKGEFGEVVSNVHPAPFDVLKGEAVGASLAGFEGRCAPAVTEGLLKGAARSLTEITNSALVCSFAPSDGSIGGASSLANDHDLLMFVPKSENVSMVVSCLYQSKAK